MRYEGVGEKEVLFDLSLSLKGGEDGDAVASEELDGEDRARPRCLAAELVVVHHLEFR